MDKNVNDEKKHNQMKLDTENLAMPEIHMKQEQTPEDEENSEDGIDFSGAIPEIHFHKKKTE